MREVANCWDNDQNKYLDTKVKKVRSNISTFEHCTNLPHMEMLEHTLVMSEMLTVVWGEGRREATHSLVHQPSQITLGGPSILQLRRYAILNTILCPSLPSSPTLPLPPSHSFSLSLPLSIWLAQSPDDKQVSNSKSAILRPFSNGIYGVNNGSNQHVITLISSRNSHQMDAVVHCMEHCAKPKSVG